MTDFFAIIDELELDFATRPSEGGGDVRQRVESIFIGLESRLIGSPSTIGHQREISDVGRRPAARALFSSGANLRLPPPFISL